MAEIVSDAEDVILRIPPGEEEIEAETEAEAGSGMGTLFWIGIIIIAYLIFEE